MTGRPNVLAGLRLDRAATARSEPEQVERAWRDPRTRVLPVWRSRHLVTGGESPAVAFLAPPAVGSLEGSSAGGCDPRVWLGVWEGRSYFAVDLSDLDDPLSHLSAEPGQELLSLRQVAPLVSQEDGALLAYANGMMTWHRRHRYCGTCGHPTEVDHAGHLRRCSNGDCATPHFPRTDPAVIMLVTRGEHCLLGRQPGWPDGLYSTLAGFVEPGESLEEAVAREVHEETAVSVEGVRYHSSQPWPFPCSLMLGFTARATSRAITLQPDEIEDARWFTRGEITSRPDIHLPSGISIARRLVEDWLHRDPAADGRGDG